MKIAHIIKYQWTIPFILTSMKHIETHYCTLLNNLFNTITLGYYLYWGLTYNALDESNLTILIIIILTLLYNFLLHFPSSIIYTTIWRCSSKHNSRIAWSLHLPEREPWTLLTDGQIVSRNKFRIKFTGEYSKC